MGSGFRFHWSGIDNDDSDDGERKDYNANQEHCFNFVRELDQKDLRATEAMLAEIENLLADLPARAARVCRCKCTGCTTRKVQLRNMTESNPCTCADIPVQPMLVILPTWFLLTFVWGFATISPTICSEHTEFQTHIEVHPSGKIIYLLFNNLFVFCSFLN